MQRQGSQSSTSSVSLCVELMVSKNASSLSENTRSFVESKLLSALSDPDATVRQGAAYDICDAALSNLSRVSESLLRAVAERVKDKKATIARDAITGLVQVYRAWTYDIEEEEEEKDEEDEDATEILVSRHERGIVLEEQVELDPGYALHVLVS